MQELEFEHWAPKNFSKTARWNPDKKHVSYALASANKLELNTLDSEAHEQTTVISFKVEISLYEWSPCGKFIYVYLKKQNLLSIFDVDKQKIVHSILTDDVGDLLAIKWSPDSLNLLGLSADRSLLMIWPLNLCDSPQRERTSKSYERGNLAIKYPKILPLISESLSLLPGVCVTLHGDTLFVAKRTDGIDFMYVYDTINWQLAHRFECPTQDLHNFYMTPDQRHLVMIDAPWTDRVFIIARDGFVLQTYDLMSYFANMILAHFSPRGKYIAYENENRNIVIVHAISGKAFAEFHHSHNLDPHQMCVLVESLLEDSRINSDSINSILDEEEEYPSQPKTKYEHQYSPINLPILKSTASHKPLRICWSFDECYVASVSDLMPNVLWVWQLQTQRPIICFVQQETIEAISWSPCSHALVFSSGNSKVFLWTPGSLTAHVVDLHVRDETKPDEFRACKLSWSPDSQSILAKDSSRALHIRFQDISSLTATDTTG